MPKTWGIFFMVNIIVCFFYLCRFKLIYMKESGTYFLAFSNKCMCKMTL